MFLSFFLVFHVLIVVIISIRHMVKIHTRIRYIYVRINNVASIRISTWRAARMGGTDKTWV